MLCLVHLLGQVAGTCGLADPGKLSRHLGQVLGGVRDGLDGHAEGLEPLLGDTQASELEGLVDDGLLLRAPAHDRLVELEELVPRVDRVANLFFIEARFLTFEPNLT